MLGGKKGQGGPGGRRGLQTAARIRGGVRSVENYSLPLSGQHEMNSSHLEADGI